MVYLSKHKKWLSALLFTGFQCMSVMAITDSTECQRMKKGRFNYSNELSQTILVERNRTRQIETNTATSQIVKYSIKWLSDCSYQIKQVWSNKRLQRKNNGATTLVMINKTGPMYYEYSCVCTSVADREKSKGVMYLQQ